MKIVAAGEEHIKSLTDHSGNLQKMLAEKDEYLQNLTKHLGNLGNILAEKDQLLNLVGRSVLWKLAANYYAF